MNIVPGVQMVNMTVMLQTPLLLSPFSGFLLYLYNGTGYKYFESRGAQFKDLGTSNIITSFKICRRKYSIKKPTALIQF
jgi:hypothetical protein